MRMAARQQGPGGTSKDATQGTCSSIKTVGKPKLVNAKLGKSQDMEDRRQKTDIVPGDLMDRLGGWYGKKPRPEGGMMAGLRRYFG